MVARLSVQIARPRDRAARHLQVERELEAPLDDRPWITSAETAEAAMALARCGMVEEAKALFEWVQYQRHLDGSYWTGATFPDGRHFPNERSTWSGAAIVLANDVITGRGPIAEIFGHRVTDPIALN